jgi:outer membrane lipoprotein carrier protein
MAVQRRTRLSAPLAIALAAASAGAAPRADLFDDLYQRGHQQNGAMRTLTASFTETTTSSLLTRPLIARGTVAVERPGRVALRYVEPDERVVIVDGARMTLAVPSLGILQTRDIGAAERRVQKYFVDSSPDELRSHFDVRARERPDRSGYVIAMVPKRKQIKEGLTSLELSIDATSLLMTSMTMTFPNGDSKLMTFTDVKPHAALDPAAFAVAREGATKK